MREAKTVFFKDNIGILKGEEEDDKETAVFGNTLYIVREKKLEIHRNR